MHPTLFRLDSPDLQGSVARGNKTFAVKMRSYDVVRIAARIVAGERSYRGYIVSQYFYIFFFYYFFILLYIIFYYILYIILFFIYIFIYIQLNLPRTGHS